MPLPTTPAVLPSPREGSQRTLDILLDLQISLWDLMVKEDIKDQKKLMDFFIKKAKKAKEAGVSYPFPSINKTLLTKQQAVLLVDRLKGENEELGKRLEVEHTVNILVEENSHQLLFLNKVLEEKVKELQKERDQAKQERDQAKQEEKEEKEETDRLKKDNKWLLSAIKDYETYQPVNMKYMPSKKHQAKTIPK